MRKVGTMRASTTIGRIARLTTILALAACGSDGGEAESAVPSGTEAESPDPPFGGADPDPAASIRFVNLWVEDGAGASVDVHMRGMRGDEHVLFENVGSGTVTATAPVPPDVWLNVYRADDAGTGDPVATHFLSRSDLGAGTRLTLVLTYFRPIREGGMASAVGVFQDTGNFITGGMPARPVDGALLVADLSAVTRVLGETHEPLQFGTPGSGCLRPAGSPPPSAGSGAITTSVGGTAVVTYDVAPGSHRIAAYPMDDVRCDGPPRVGPVEVDVAADGRTYIFVYAMGPDDLRLLPVAASGK